MRLFDRWQGLVVLGSDPFGQPCSERVYRAFVRRSFRHCFLLVRSSLPPPFRFIKKERPPDGLLWLAWAVTVVCSVRRTTFLEEKG